MAQVSSLSLTYIKVPVSATESGATVDPTSGTVTMAFPAPGVEPSSWNTASWETDATRTPSRYYARCLVGPAGTVTLTDGTYDVWIKVSGISPEVPVIKAGTALIVT